MKSKQKKRNRILTFVAALAFVSLLLCACSQVRLRTSAVKDALIQVGEDATCSRQEGVFMLMEEKSWYEQGQDPAVLWKEKAGSVNLEDYVKETVEDKLIRFTAAAILSDRLAAYPTDEEKEQAGEDAVAAWTRISGLYDVSEYGITVDNVHELYEKKAVYQAVFDKITNDAAEDVTEENTRVMLGDYVIIPNADGEEAANQVREAALAGKDLKDACSEAGYALLENQTIKRGELPPTIDSIAFALKDGEMSEVVESKSGFYIIRCQEDHLLEESAENYNEVLAKTKESAFQDAWYEFSKGEQLYFDSKYWDQLDIGSMQ